MNDPFEEFDAIEAETKPIEKTIKGEKFVFPGTVPADVAMEFMNAIIVNPDVDLGLLATLSLSKIVSEEDLERLSKVTSLAGIDALARGLFQRYGLLEKKAEANRPNRQTRRTSRKKSSKGSAHSAQGSVVSTT